VASKGLPTPKGKYCRSAWLPVRLGQDAYVAGGELPRVIDQTFSKEMDNRGQFFGHCHNIASSGKLGWLRALPSVLGAMEKTRKELTPLGIQHNAYVITLCPGLLRKIHGVLRSDLQRVDSHYFGTIRKCHHFCHCHCQPNAGKAARTHRDINL
jgi:hypothetical protein